MQGTDFVVGKVHRDLSHVVLLNIPADGFYTLQFARNTDGFPVFIVHNFARIGVAFALDTTCLADIKGDAIGDAGAFGIQVYVVCDKEIAGTDYGGAGRDVHFCRSIIRRPFWQFDFFKKAFVFPGANHTEIVSLRVGLCGFI